MKEEYATLLQEGNTILETIADTHKPIPDTEKAISLFEKKVTDYSATIILSGSRQL